MLRYDVFVVMVLNDSAPYQPKLSGCHSCFEICTRYGMLSIPRAWVG